MWRCFADLGMWKDRIFGLCVRASSVFELHPVGLGLFCNVWLAFGLLFVLFLLMVLDFVFAGIELRLRARSSCFSSADMRIFSFLGCLRQWNIL